MADRRLQVFHTVARLLSFTRAAENLQMTQPAVTFQIRQLEEQLKVRLFDRSHNRIDLTEAGRRAFEYSERIFSLYGEMENAIREVTGDVSGVFRIGAGSAVAQYILTPILAAFKEKFPVVQIRLDVGSCSQVISMVENSFVDLGIVEAAINNKKLLSEIHGEEEWRFVVHPNHPLAQAQSISAEQLGQQTWILANEAADAREIISSYLEDIGVDLSKLHVVMEMGSFAVTKHAVEAGQGVAILPRPAISKELKLGTLLSPAMQEPLVKPVSFVYKQQKFPLKIVDELLAIAKKAESRGGLQPDLATTVSN